MEISATTEDAGATGADTIALGALIAAIASGVVSAYLFATGDAPGKYEAYGAQPKITPTPKGAAFSIDF